MFFIGKWGSFCIRRWTYSELTAPTELYSSWHHRNLWGRPLYWHQVKILCCWCIYHKFLLIIFLNFYWLCVTKNLNAKYTYLFVYFYMHSLFIIVNYILPWQSWSRSVITQCSSTGLSSSSQYQPWCCRPSIWLSDIYTSFWTTPYSH